VTIIVIVLILVVLSRWPPKSTENNTQVYCDF